MAKVTVDKLPDDIIFKITTMLDVQSLSNLTHIESRICDIASDRLDDLKIQWKTWLEKGIYTKLKLKGHEKDHLNMILFDFIHNDVQCKTTETMNPVQRKFIHMRAESAGLKSETVKRKNNQASIMLTKPEGWVLPITPRIPNRIAEDKLRKASWRAECSECSCVLDVNTALYHYSGMGPLCSDCIENDDYLDGLKWEAKAAFW